MARVYLDWAGFSPVDPRVIGVMRPFLESGIGNPTGAHSYGSEARTALESARVKVARLFGGGPAGIVFTSGATEANNLAVRGLLAQSSDRRHVVASSIEHVSVVDSCRDLERRGHAVTWLPVDPRGRLDPGTLGAAVRPETALVSVLAGSGEIGTLQPLREIGRVTRSRGVPLHVDAVGVAGRCALSVDECAIDLLTLSSNDLSGPPGVGALWIRPGAASPAPLLLGGDQENGLRSGTPNLPAIVGMGVAADLARSEWPREMERLRVLRDRLLTEVVAAVRGARVTGAAGPDRLPHHASFVVADVEGDGVLRELDRAGIAAAGAASHVLHAIGCPPSEQRGALCFTLGRWTTTADIDAVVAVMPPIVERLRPRGPGP